MLRSAANADDSPATGGDREPVLDGVRGLAILLVFVYHLGAYAGIRDHAGLDRLIYKATSPLSLGVDLFFVLSGFLITGILYEAKGSPLFFRSFYGRRVLRIFPLYYGFLAVALLVFPHWLPPESARSLVDSQGWYWLYLSNVQVALSGAWQEPLHLGHFWSLAVEEQFYLLWPLAVWALDRKGLMRLAVACFVAALVLRLILPFGMTELAAKVLLPTRMDALAAGAFLALAIRGERGMNVLARWPAVIFVACGLAFVALQIDQDPSDRARAVERAVRHTIIAGGCAALIALMLTASARDWRRRAFSAAPLVFFGKYSYGLYVVHVPIILFAAGAGFRPDAFVELWGSMLPGLIVFGAACVGLSVLCAVLIYHAWEAPFLRLKRYLPYRAAPSKTKTNAQTQGRASRHGLPAPHAF